MTASATEHNAAGMSALRAGRFAEAAECFADALRYDQAPALWMNLASARRGAGDDTGERAALDGALSCDQRHLMANLRLAELLERVGEAGEAMGRWQGLVTLLAEETDLPPELRPLRERAEERARAHGERLATVVDDAMAHEREALSAPERRRADACIGAMLGRRRIYRNECHGLYYPFLPADEFFDRDRFPWFAELESEWEAVRDEFITVLAAEHADFAPYVQMEQGTPENKWSPLDHSPAWTALHLWKYGERKPAADACPVTTALIDRLPIARMPRRAPNVFFSILRAGSRLPAHTGVSNVRAIVHLPLIVPQGCGFRVGGETRQWREGEAFAFDDTIEHEAWNDSGQLRAVLILDTWNPHLSDRERELVVKLLDTADAAGRPQVFAD